MNTIANELFVTARAYDAVEDRMGQLLSEIYGEGGWEDFTHDGYDESIEVYGVTPAPDASARLHAAGFSIVWQHAHPKGTPPTGGRVDLGDCGCKSS